MADLSKKLFFDDVRKKNWPKTGKFFTVCFGPPSQSIERGRISRKGALDVRESRERRDEIVPKFSPEKQEKRNFGLIFFTFLRAGSLVVRESRHRHDRISDINSRKRKRRKRKNGSESFFSNVGVRIPFSIVEWYFHFFGRGKTHFFGGGV